jgi:tetratricopeptide (TPR) repeat protein
MLYYIIPPIVIIISLSLLVGFLFKKSNELRDVIESEQRAIIERRERKISKISPVALKLLERMTQKFKLLSLKFYNHSDQWFQSLKQKREKRLLESKKLEAEQYREVEKNVIDAVDRANVNQEKRNKLETFFRKTRRVDNIEPEIKKPVAPMISQRIVQPESRIQKNMLEDILIERIAVNPRDIEAYERLGDYYIEINNLSDSMECFKQVIKLSPANRKAKTSLRKIEKILAR